MATNRGRSPTPSARTPRLAQTNLKKSAQSSFRIQSAPPLSIQQYLRSACGVLPGAEEWKYSGKYREPVYRAYLSRETREIRKKPEPVWRPVSRYQEKPPTSLDPDFKVVERKPEPVWHPPGKVVEKPTTYFDAPSLRWSLQDLLRSMPEMRPKTFHASKSMSTLRKSKTQKEEKEEH